MELNKYIDHTVLKATTSPKDIIKLCNEAKEYNFYAVCVNSCYVLLAAKELKNSHVKVAAVVGFPLGANSCHTKVCEAAQCIKDGADEIDMVLNIGLLKAKLHKSVREEISAVKEAIGSRTLKVILETCYLTDDEVRIACQIAKRAGADFVKTSTGFGTDGATENVVKIMIYEVGDTLKIKASGGIKDTETAKKYIEMGVSRIGTSSGIEIVTSTKKDTDEHTY
ncbi:deoxyribose-phosphate aldolase [Aequorivita sublithincola DSM 14238]|uniref:Deoxyribose-phosphate aldolase n=1 Tax=Aequorivita sublithincola (strain DSM 14238 / LMG 21431 / ACAM 643 / 9-3) TaxID=746697 RepID=I3YRR5_AEQSU|nr:deoxyribose-phosphate aldolase [Aequorivita sublithincola]AFL79683.1 deoxyribose-phosphate aldolase [Aequorivita sublithincola DSM 14238]